MPDFEGNELPEEKYFREIKEKYQFVFSTSFGIDVLADILADCSFGSTLNPENKEQIGRYNAGITILGKTGFLEKGTRNIIMALLGPLNRPE